MRVLETERLSLRRLSTADAGFILGLLNEPSFLRFIGDRGVRTLEDSRRYILEGPVASYERLGFGLYLVELKSSAAPIGICGLLRRDSLADVDIGFAFKPRFWSRGYAVESATAVLAHGRDDFGLERIVAITSPGNAASIAVLSKIGLEHERRMRLSDGGEEIELFATTAACSAGDPAG